MTNSKAPLIPLPCPFGLVFHSHIHKGQEAAVEAVLILAL